MTLLARIMVVVSLLLGGGVLVISRRHRDDQTGMFSVLYLVVGLVFVSSLRDALPLPHAARVAGFAVQGVLTLALVWRVFRMAKRSS